MKVSVIVPAYNNPECLETCLEAIGTSSWGNFEVIVVDDGSTIPLQAIVDKHAFKYVRFTKNHGAATARNVGASHASGEILFFVDSDVRIKPDTIKNVANAFNDPRIDVYQGLASKTPLNEGFGPHLMALKWFFMLKDIREASFVYSHVFSIRKRVFDDAGGFNESFKAPGFGDEFEFGHRLRKKHVIHVDPDLLVDHKFQGIIARARSLYHRAYTWAKIFASTGHFEKANASTREAFIGIIIFMMLVSTPGFLLNPWLALIPLVLFIIHAALNARFYAFLKKEQGTRFTIRAIFPNMLWSFAQLFGGMQFLVKHVLGIDHLARINVFRMIGFRASRQPSHVVLFVTAKCNARCRHCFYWQEISRTSEGPTTRNDELTLEELCSISKNMGHVEMLTITGGEPTLRDDLAEIISTFYRYNGTSHVTIHTNGLLGDQLRRVLKKVFNSCPRIEINASLSIDGLKEVHDETRGVVGAFNRAMDTLMMLEKAKMRYPNLNITINTVFTRLNQDNVKRFIDHVYSSHAIDGFYLALVRGATRDPDIKNIDIQKYSSAIDHLENIKSHRGAYDNYALAGLRNAVDDLAPRDVIKTVIKERNVYPCKAGQTVIVISERGEVSPCEMLGFSFGNLRDFNFNLGRIMSTPRAKRILKAIKGSSCTCTWECAVMNNIVFNWRAFPRVVWQRLKKLSSMR